MLPKPTGSFAADAVPVAVEPVRVAAGDANRLERVRDLAAVEVARYAQARRVAGLTCGSARGARRAGDGAAAAPDPLAARKFRCGVIGAAPLERVPAVDVHPCVAGRDELVAEVTA